MERSYCELWLRPLILTVLIVASPGSSAFAASAEWSDWNSSVQSTRELVVEGLPAEAPVEGTLITVDTTRNIVYLFKDGELVRQDKAATGMDKMLKKGQRTWLFRTPRGLMPIQRKIVDPVWTKPDWAFVEKGQKIPPIDSPKRREAGTLGKYALDLGDGILIHGTKDLASLGKKASHGCIRVGPKMLELLFTEAEVGTMVYVF
ncbi:MAG: L,D-transpeptidase [Acidobacteria bacterium]|nr:L,D-transpeptidase [Acidobacteriota bacterium]